MIEQPLPSGRHTSLLDQFTMNARRQSVSRIATSAAIELQLLVLFLGNVVRGLPVEDSYRLYRTRDELTRARRSEVSRKKHLSTGTGSGISYACMVSCY
jgi:hypothetical protein